MELSWAVFLILAFLQDVIVSVNDTCVLGHLAHKLWKSSSPFHIGARRGPWTLQRLSVAFWPRWPQHRFSDFSGHFGQRTNYCEWARDLWLRQLVTVVKQAKSAVWRMPRPSSPADVASNGSHGYPSDTVSLASSIATQQTTCNCSYSQRANGFWFYYRGQSWGWRPRVKQIVDSPRCEAWKKGSL